MQVLNGLAWPFVAFAISLPVVLILNANMAQLIAIKRTLDEAPDKLMNALDGVAKFKDNIDEIRAQVSNDLNETLSGAEMRLAALSECSNLFRWRVCCQRRPHGAREVI